MKKKYFKPEAEAIQVGRARLCSNSATVPDVGPGGNLAPQQGSDESTNGWTAGERRDLWN